MGHNGNDAAYEHESSLLVPSQGREAIHQGPDVEVPCVVFDDWCSQNQIRKIDVLRLELEGSELKVLQSSPDILKTVKVIILQSYFYPYRVDMVDYFALKDFLTRSHFVPLAHWYNRGERGTAVYVSEELFDAYFVRCLGLGLGGILYP